MKKIFLLFLCFTMLFICSCKKQNNNNPHTHNFIEGTCSCGEKDPEYVAPHVHNYIKGECSCGAIDSKYEPIIKIDIVEATLQESYYIDEFDITTIVLSILIDDEVINKNLTKSMIENYPLELVNGSYTFVINYQGTKKELTLNFKEKEIYTEGLLFTLNKTKDGYLVSSYDGISEEVIIPSTYKDLPVVGIKAYAFNNNKIVSNIILPDTIEVIEQNAFFGSTISKINIPESVTTIKDAAFYYCENLKSIFLPETIDSIGAYAFYNVKLVYTNSTDISNWNQNAFDDNLVYIHKGIDLEKIYIENDFEYYIDEDVKILNYLGSSTSVTIPATFNSKPVVEISNSAFLMNKSLEEVIIGENVTIIKDKAFRETGLKTVEIPSKVKEVGIYAFSACEALETVIFNEGLEIINISAFAACSNLETAILPSTLKRIEQYGFQNCLKITTIYIPKTVEYIGEGAFYACHKATLFIESEIIPTTWHTNFNPSGAKKVLSATKENII